MSCKKEMKLKVTYVQMEDLSPAEHERVNFYRKQLRLQVGRILYEEAQRIRAERAKQKNNGKETK